jgi:hypothetical protein
MKLLKDALEKSVPAFYRFQIFMKNENGIKRNVGMAYLCEGHSVYTLRLWTFLNEKFFLYPSKNDPRKYFIMTKEINKSPNPKRKFHWNVIGSARADASQNVFELSFDLLEKKIFMSIYPDKESPSRNAPELDEIDLAA